MPHHLAPSPATLATLTTLSRKALARHVVGCRSCQALVRAGGEVTHCPQASSMTAILGRLEAEAERRKERNRR